MKNELLQNINKLHTTKLGVTRIQKNLSLDTEDVVAWCKEKALLTESSIERSGKNWYIATKDCIITVNAHSYTIITAHKKRKILKTSNIDKLHLSKRKDRI
ncbi:DUF3781 domain-containing protein [Candidatus Galacturonibacter soehngenii]|uniref:DUF3781 domain-containing protein n=1 Tax=Candidatus Galacturonatibacter soehngenii TaxID=2307010 RepID=A0A7V7QNW1_9FIRM|nr:DUF3781 domain-containing protein [Candidatus Galacturonibacter soehngenii]KAB1440208.1 DUF3781 domain-containing protein [Candidatus Galacturonibacter soehngenii]